MSSLDQATANGARKAAILLSFLGEEEAAPVLRNLSSDDVERISTEVANLTRVPIEITLQVLEEYHQMMAAREYIAAGGRDVAIRLLVKAFGENGAKTMVQRLTHPEDKATFKVDALKKTEPQQLARFLAGEHAQTKALILGHLDPKQASALLMKPRPGSARRLRKAHGDNGTVFSGRRSEGFPRVESPFRIRGGAEQAHRLRSQESRRPDESSRTYGSSRDSGEDRGRRTQAGHYHSGSHVYLREFPRSSRAGSA